MTVLTSDHPDIRGHEIVLFHILFVIDTIQHRFRVFVIFTDQIGQCVELAQPGLLHPFDDRRALMQFVANLLIADIVPFFQLVKKRTAIIIVFVRLWVPPENEIGDRAILFRIIADDLGNFHTAPDRFLFHPRDDLNGHRAQRVEEDGRHIERLVGETIDQRFDGIRVHGRVGGMTRRHCLEEDICLLPADLAHENIIGALPQRILQ